ncbi:MAG: TPM domain-containing protein [Spirochaetales bacterium]|nr:TPM domain-containing protein [Spirochaetales bacterium]
MKCPSCSFAVNDSVDRCPACGFHLEDLGKRIANLPRKRGWLIDAADAVEEEYANRLYRYLIDFNTRTGIEFYVLTLPDAGGVKPEEFVFYFLNHHRIGGERHKGLVLALFEKEKTIACEVGYSLEDALSDDAARDILSRDAAPRLSQGERGAALYSAVELLGDILAHGRSRFKRFLGRLGLLFRKGVGA